MKQPHSLRIQDDTSTSTRHAVQNPSRHCSLYTLLRTVPALHSRVRQKGTKHAMRLFVAPREFAAQYNASRVTRLGHGKGARESNDAKNASCTRDNANTRTHTGATLAHRRTRSCTCEEITALTASRVAATSQSRRLLHMGADHCTHQCRFLLFNASSSMPSCLTRYGIATSPHAPALTDTEPREAAHSSKAKLCQPTLRRQVATTVFHNTPSFRC